MESNTNQTYTLILYPKKNYYGEKDKLPTHINIDKDIAINDSIDKIYSSNWYWLYEIILTNIEEVYDKKQKINKLITTKSLINRFKLSNMLYDKLKPGDDYTI
jgi:hypothetical protein